MRTPIEIVNALEIAGREIYGREAVNQQQHALQCAALAEDEGASPALITAALLHDIGHIVDSKHHQGQNNDIDRQHEKIGAAYLKRWFPPTVTEPVRLHVPAKRYLCAVAPEYLDGLSPASIRSLELQGGPFSSEDADAFIEVKHAEDAVRLRRWDDRAKDPKLVTPPLPHFLKYVEQVCDQPD